MKRVLRALGLVVATLLFLAVATGLVFWITVPATPALPADFELPAADSAVTNPALREELLRMAALDQAVRDSSLVGDMTDARMTVTSLWHLAQHAVRLGRVDVPNTERLQEIIAEHGWPTRAQVGADGRKAVFLIVQHADRDPAFQRSALGPMRTAYREGDASGSDVAMLTDRVRVAEGRPQVYGSQISVMPGEAPALQPIENLASVDARRAAMGLPPLAEYLEELCSDMDICVGR